MLPPCARADRARARELKKALDPYPPDDPADDTKWHEIMGPIMGGWMGEAVDGRGHHDGMCEYFVEVPIEDFGHKFFAGGEARWIQHYPEKIPSAGGATSGGRSR